MVSLCHTILSRRRLVDSKTVTSIPENNMLRVVISSLFLQFAKCSSIACHSIPWIDHSIKDPLVLRSVLICGVPEVLHLDVWSLVSGVSSHLFIFSLRGEWLHSAVNSQVNSARFVNIPVGVRRDNLSIMTYCLVSNLDLLVDRRYRLLTVSKNGHEWSFLRGIIFVQVHSTGQVSDVSKLWSTPNSVIL